MDIMGVIDKLIKATTFAIGKSGGSAAVEFFERSKRQKLSIKGTQSENMQDYGFYSVLNDKGECITIHPQGSNKGIVIKADMPQYRPDPSDLEPGEVGIFNSDGVRIRLLGKSVIVEGADDILLGDERTSTSVLKETILNTLLNHTHTTYPTGGESTPSVALKALAPSELVTNTKVE